MPRKTDKPVAMPEDPKHPGYDMMGQPLGSQNLDDIPEVEEDGPLEPITDIAQPEEIPEDPEPQPVLGKKALLEALGDPDVRRELLKGIAETPEGRELLNIPAGKGPPSGHWHRDYHRERDLRVTGGVEVAHDDPTKPPDPPSYIRKYIGQIEGTETDYADLSQVSPDRRETANVAKIGPDGKPMKTPQYKAFIDKRREGGRLDGRVRTDIQVGAYQPEGGAVKDFVTSDEGHI